MTTIDLARQTTADRTQEEDGRRMSIIVWLAAAIITVPVAFVVWVLA